MCNFIGSWNAVGMFWSGLGEFWACIILNTVLQMAVIGKFGESRQDRMDHTFITALTKLQDQIFT